MQKAFLQGVGNVAFIKKKVNFLIYLQTVESNLLYYSLNYTWVSPDIL